MSGYRQIHTQIWKDAWFLELSANEKLLFVYLFSNERASICGLYELAPRVITFETGLAPEVVDTIMATFQAAGKVYYEGGLVWVVNLRKYNENNSPKVRTKITNDLALIPDCPIKKRYLAFYAPPDTLSVIPDTLSENESEQEQEIKQEQEQGRNNGHPPPPAIGNPKEPRTVAGMVEQAFRIAPDWSTKAGTEFLTWLKERPLSETVSKFAKWWYEQDWRGKKGEPPSLGQIRQNWPQAFSKPPTKDKGIRYVND